MPGRMCGGFHPIVNSTIVKISWLVDKSGRYFGCRYSLQLKYTETKTLTAEWPVLVSINTLNEPFINL